MDSQNSSKANDTPSSAASGTLTAEQIKIIKSTVPVLVEHGENITKRFYHNIITQNPSLNDIFNTANQKSGHQPKALAGALYAYASYIDDLGKLSAAVELISHKHASLYIQADSYGVVATYLLVAMKEILGDAMTKEVHDAWAAAYWQLAHIMIGKEKALYQQAQGWTDWKSFKIARKEKESDEITSFYLEPVDGKPLPSFLPGQYISVRTLVPELSHLQCRQYSLSDRPRPDYFRISVKREDGINMEAANATSNPGYISNLLHANMNVGDVIGVSHPYGVFYLDPNAEPKDAPVVLVSAGVGLTCLQSILNTLVDQNSTRPITFIHGARTSTARAFRKHMDSVTSTKSNVHAIYFTSKASNSEDEITGRLNLEKVDREKDLFLGDNRTQYYVCGPAKFMIEVRDALHKMGVDQQRVHVELFGTGGVPHA